MWVVLLLALGSGLAAAWLALNYLQQQTDVAAPGTVANVDEVVVAARDLSLGHVLTPEDIKLVQWPGDYLPEGYGSSSDELLGRGLITPVKENEPLLSTKLALKEAGGGLPIVIEPGKRAVSVEVDEVVGVAGFVLPGARVDVVVTLDQGNFQENPVARIVLQGIPVLASGQELQVSADGQPQTVTVITLQVDPEQAEVLILSATKGHIQLALRNTLDLDTLETAGIRVQGLVPTQRQARAAPRRTTPRPQQPSGSTIEVYRGPELTEETVEEGGGSQ
jgi:pilus assembly protein CpaB